jgi:hypothetical protein
MHGVKLLVLAGAFLSFGNAFAQADDKTVSSVSCRGYGINTSDAELTFQNAGLYNPQNTFETVICPIMLDQEGGWGTTQFTDAIDISVGVRIGAVPTKAGCTLFRTVGTVTSAIGGFTAPSNYPANTLQNINFTNTVATGETDGITLVCTVGPKVAITRINTQEWTETGPTITP